VWIAFHQTVPQLSSDRDPRFASKLRCEDAAASWNFGDVGILVVADGLGSSHRPADASLLASSIAIRNLCRDDFSGLGEERDASRLTAAVAGIRSEFLELIDSLEDSAEWKTTLGVAVVCGRDTLAYCLIGDSILAVQQDDLEGGGASQHLHLVEHPIRVSGQPTSTETLHSEVATWSSGLVRVPLMTGVLLSTDGLEGFIQDEESIPRLDGVFRTMLEKLRINDRQIIQETLWTSEIRSRKQDDIGIALVSWI